MSLQAQQKASSKRTGKRISFFNEQGLPISGKEQQQKDETLYGGQGNVAASNALEPPKAQSVISSASNSNHVSQNSVIFSHDMGEAMRLPQQRVSDHKPNSVAVNHVPERSDANWQHHPSQMWNHGLVYSSGQKGAHPANTDFYTHEALMRSHEKGVGVSQMDLYGDAVQQMLSQKVQLEQQAQAARQHAHINSMMQAQKQQQQQKQQHHQQQQKEQQQQKQQSQHPQAHQQHQQPQPQKAKNPALPLQPFQLAFGHQGPKQGIPLPDLFHVLQEPPVPSNVHFSVQQKQALPQMQLFENFYPTHQQQTAAQAYNMQHAVSMTQSHGASQHQIQIMGHYQQAHSERNQGMLKALEQNQQMVLPKTQISFPRRSRRLSKEGFLPILKGEGAPIALTKEEQTNNPYIHQWQLHPAYHIQHLDLPGHKENFQHGQLELQPGSNQERPGLLHQCPTEPEKQPMPQNGRVAETHQALDENCAKSDASRSDAIIGGVIQSTRRRRRISQEANLLTLAQKAVELASLQSDTDAQATEEAKRNVETKNNLNCDDAPTTKKARDDGSHVPLIIPVSVPVKRFDPVDTGHERDHDWRTQGNMGHIQNLPGQNPSVIVTRQRCTRANNSETALQDRDAPKEEGENQCRKPKQRPRPEPLFIPPKPGTFIVPPVYSNITPYQSHLRSPVRLADHPADRTFMLPPYTPPPILSPVREGSGLYFNAILTASSHYVPPPFTPKSARTLLRAVSSDVTPPVLTAMGDATPVSIEPRINVGCRFQAEIPELQDRRLADVDNPMADVVWQPWDDLDSSQSTQDKVETLLTAACSSILPGAGTNQELALHCLHEAKGNILVALTRLLVKRPRRPKQHPLESYHYTGSDRWTATEKKLFNKGIAIYKKDFLLVQKLIKTKTVGQCVEFYYAYKKQVKIGRNGTLIFGDVDQGVCERTAQEESEVDNKCSLRLAAAVPPRVVSHGEEAEDSAPKVVIKEEPKEVEIEEEFHERRKACTPPKPIQTLQNPEPVKEVVIQRTQEPPDRDVEKPLDVLAVKKRKPRAPAEKKKPDTSVSIPQEQEGHFPCKKCGRVFPKVKSRSAHMKSHAEQEKKAAALKERQAQAAAEEAAAAAQQAARSRKRRDESSDSGSSSSGSSSSNTSSCASSDEGEI